jgi:putative phosphoribosyl transferase
MYFRDRTEAGQLLAKKLMHFKGQPGVVLAVPRGGVPVAYEVARELELPLELILTKKIGHPMNREYAIGAASLSDYFVLPHDQVSDEYIREELARIRDKLRQMQAIFTGDKDPVSLTGKTVLVIDDGIATGNTLLGTIQLLRKSKPGRIIVAVPVASALAVEKLSKQADEVVALIIPEEFYGVGAFYENFSQVSDDEVLEYMDKWRHLKKTE